MPQPRSNRPSEPSEAGWSLCLLGTAHLGHSGIALEPLERKTAALLAYLALEGPTPRSKVAGLLWPEVDEGRARGNLRQCLHRLKRLCGEDLVVSDEILRLVSDLEADVVGLEAQAFTGEYGPALRLEGELLSGLDYDDCPELAEWLEAGRERLRGVRLEAVQAQGKALETSGDYAAALVWAERALAQEPVSEETHRWTMRLLYLLGDRAGALRAYHRCVEILRRELGIEPMGETQALARLIDRGGELPGAAQPKRAAIPLSVLRPPTLVGREREWERLEAAWERGQGIFISGPPGVGKTRLMLDFVASKGPYSLFRGRPGDAALPYGTHARTYKEMLEEFRPELPEWVRLELARLIPELGEAPGPLQSEADKLRFFQAKAEVNRLAYGRGMRVVAVDDLQFVDSQSAEAARFVFSQYWGHPDGLRTVFCFRQDELSPEMGRMLEQTVEAGLVAHIKLNPLPAPDVQTLLGSLELPVPAADLAPLGQSVSRYTGGNPMFVLETLKNLLESGRLEDGFSAQLPPPGSIGPLITKRLERLSPPALKLGRVAAVAGVDFAPEVAAAVLEIGPLDLAEPWAELEAAQILSGSAFAHDLIYEAVLGGVPGAVLTLLHWRIAAQLAPEAAAKHYWAALQGGRKATRTELEHLTTVFAGAASAFFIRGDQAAGREWFERALSVAPDSSAQVRVLVQQARLLERHLHYAEALESLDRAEGMLEGVSPVLRASLWNARALLAYSMGEAKATAAHAERAAEVLGGLDSPEAQMERANALNYLGIAAWKQNDLAAAEKHHRRALVIYRTLGDQEKLANSLQNLGIVLSYRKDPDALALLEEAGQIWQKLGFTAQLARTYNNLGLFHWRQDHLAQAENYFDQAGAIGKTLSGDFLLWAILNNLGIVRFQRGRYKAAQQAYLEALGSKELETNPEDKALILYNLVEVELRLGEIHELETYIQPAFELLAERNSALRGDLLWLEGEARVLQGDLERAQISFERSAQLASETQNPERQAEALARLARLQADFELACRAQEVQSTPNTQATVRLLEGDLAGARAALKPLDEPYEEARLLMDAAKLRSEPALSEEARQLLQEISKR